MRSLEKLAEYCVTLLSAEEKKIRFFLRSTVLNYRKIEVSPKRNMARIREDGDVSKGKVEKDQQVSEKIKVSH